MNNYQYQCVVSNSASSGTSDPVTLTVKSVPVTGVTLETDKLELFTGESETLTAKVLPETATDKSVTWESSNTTVATVDQSGNVKAEAQGTATITVKTANGGFTDTCTVTVTDKTYTITADPAKLDFDAAYLGYNAQPTAKTVTITNTGNQQVTVTLPTAKDFVITAGNGFTNGIGSRSTAICGICSALPTRTTFFSRAGSRSVRRCPDSGRTAGSGHGCSALRTTSRSTHFGGIVVAAGSNAPMPMPTGRSRTSRGTNLRKKSCSGNSRRRSPNSHRSSSRSSACAMRRSRSA